jgi:DNA-binding transcriptional MerR regulator
LQNLESQIAIVDWSIKMKLSDICRKTGISKRTIHYYIHEGLITPAIKESNGYYDFSEEDRKSVVRERV